MRYIPRGEGGAQQPSSSSGQRKNPVKLLKRDVATHYGSHELQQTLLRFSPQQLRVNVCRSPGPRSACSQAGSSQTNEWHSKYSLNERRAATNKVCWFN